MGQSCWCWSIALAWCYCMDSGAISSLLSTICRILEPLCSAGVVLIGAWLDTLLSIEVLLSIHVFYKQFLVYITPGHQVLRICYKYCLNIISWRLTRSGRNVLYRSKKHQNGRRHLLIITPSEADHVFIVHPWPHILTTIRPTIMNH